MKSVTVTRGASFHDNFIRSAGIASSWVLSALWIYNIHGRGAFPLKVTPETRLAGRYSQPSLSNGDPVIVLRA